MWGICLFLLPKYFGAYFQKPWQGTARADRSQLLLGMDFSWTSALPSLLCCNPCRRTLQISCGFYGILRKRQNIQRMSNLHVVTEFKKWEGMWIFPDWMKYMIVIISDMTVLFDTTMWSCLDVHVEATFPGCYFPFLSYFPFFPPALANYQCSLFICPDFLLLSTPCCVGWNCTRLFGSDCSRWNAD